MESLESYQDDLADIMVNVSQASCLSESNIPLEEALEMIYVDTDEFIYDQYRSVVVGDDIYFDGSFFEVYHVNTSNLSSISFLRSKANETLTLAELEEHSIKVALSDADFFAVMDCDPTDVSQSMSLRSGAVSPCDANDLTGRLRVLPGSSIIRVIGSIDWGDGSPIEAVDFIPFPGPAAQRTESFDHVYPVDGLFFVEFTYNIFTDNGDECAFSSQWPLRSSSSSCRIAQIAQEETVYSVGGGWAVDLKLKKGRTIWNTRAKFDTENWMTPNIFSDEDHVVVSTFASYGVTGQWQTSECEPGNTTNTSAALQATLGNRLRTKTATRSHKYYKSSDIFGDYAATFADGVPVQGRMYLDVGCF